jgi:hypothetical protein
MLPSGLHARSPEEALDCAVFVNVPRQAGDALLRPTGCGAAYREIRATRKRANAAQVVAN